MIISILGLLVAGSTLAYFIDQDEHTQALFVVGSVKIASGEVVASELDITQPLTRYGSWTLKNTGTQGIMIRAKINADWVPDEPSSYTIDVTSEGWEEEEGLYYYSKQVSPQEEIVLEVELNIANDNGSYWEGDVTFFFEAEAVQADSKAIQEEWPESPYQ